MTHGQRTAMEAQRNPADVNLAELNFAFERSTECRHHPRVQARLEVPEADDRADRREDDDAQQDADDNPTTFAHGVSASSMSNASTFGAPWAFPTTTTV